MNAINDLFLGWDVGGWHCDKNAKSRDALCALEMKSSGPVIVGEIFRGNLRESLTAEKGPALIAAILKRIGPEAGVAAHVTIAIDSPLAWPKAAVALMGGGEVTEVPEKSERNPYLYRAQESRLFVNRRGPLSPVKDMIGSQSTKAIHFLTRAALVQKPLGVWSSDSVVAIEAYPAPTKRVKSVSASAEKLLKAYLKHNKPHGKAWTNDVRDAIVCALVAFLHRRYPEQLVSPDGDAEPTEGWIWLPKATAKIPER